MGVGSKPRFLAWLSFSLGMLIAVAQSPATAIDPQPLPVPGVIEKSAQLVGTSPAGGSLFGQAIALSGDTLAVGSSSAAADGGVYMFERDVDGNWARTAFLEGLPPVQGGVQFGYDVALSGDTLVASYWYMGGGQAARVYERSGGSWALQADLTVPGAGTQSPTSVAVDGDVAVVGMPRNNVAFLFERVGSTWSMVKALSGEAGQSHSFGTSVDVLGGSVVVGDPDEGSGGVGVDPLPAGNAPSSGAVYLFEKNLGAWAYEHWFKAAQPDWGAMFGWSVSLDAGLLAVGSMNEGGELDAFGPGEGAAYVFRLTDGQWTQEERVQGLNTELNDSFGFTVAISGDALVVGAINEDGFGAGVNPPSDNAAEGAGAGYLYLRAGSDWLQRAYIKSTPSYTGYNYGFDVETDGETAYVSSRSAGSNVVDVYVPSAGGAFDPPATGFTATTLGGQTAAKAYEFVAGGLLPLTLSADTPYITGADAGDFKILSHDCPLGSAMSMDSRCTVQVAFDPSVEGSKQAELALATQSGVVETPLLGTATLASQTVTWAPRQTSVRVTEGQLQPDPAVRIPQEGGALSYSIVDAGSTGCRIDAVSGLVTFVAPGSCTARASAAEVQHAFSAASADVVFTVQPAPEVPCTPSAQTGVSINAGAPFTNTKRVTLDLDYPPCTQAILISNDGGFRSASTFAPSATIDWMLDDSVKGKFTKVVYVRLLAPGLDAGQTYSDDVILDTEAPVIESAEVSPTTSSAATLAAAKTRLLIRIKARDNRSGVRELQLSQNKRKVIASTKYKKRVRVQVPQAKAKNYWVRVRDGAGNWSKWRRA